MRRAILLLPLMLACADPVTAVRTVDARPRILVQGAPAGAVLFVDGKPMGAAAAYSGAPGVLVREPGTHVVEIKAGETLLLSQKVFLGGGEQRTLTVAGVAR